MQKYDVVVIGGGQSGLSVGYYLRRTGLKYVILDQEEKAGSAWQHTWKSLRLFSPAKWSSLPGVMMSGGPDYYPTRDETIEYLSNYEAKYKLRVKRPVRVHSVKKEDELFRLNTSGRISTDWTKVTGIKGLWLVGYGNWTGFASATLIGVGRNARKTVEELTEYVEAVFSEQN